MKAYPGCDEYGGRVDSGVGLWYDLRTLGAGRRPQLIVLIYRKASNFKNTYLRTLSLVQCLVAGHGKRPGAKIFRCWSSHWTTCTRYVCRDYWLGSRSRWEVNEGAYKLSTCVWSLGTRLGDLTDPSCSPHWIQGAQTHHGTLCGWADGSSTGDNYNLEILWHSGSHRSTVRVYSVIQAVGRTFK